MRVFAIATALVVSLASVSVAQEEEKPKIGRHSHWGHCLSVPAVADIAAVQSITVASDSFELSEGLTETPDFVRITEIPRNKYGEFSARDWQFRKPIRDAWFELDEAGTPTLHIIPREKTIEEIFTFRKIDGPPDKTIKLILPSRKTGDPPAEQYTVWFMEECFPYCKQPQRHAAYQQVAWWKVFRQPEKQHYKLLMTDPPQLEGYIAMTIGSDSPLYELAREMMKKLEKKD